jgi:hypothetical protein
MPNQFSRELEYQTGDKRMKLGTFDNGMLNLNAPKCKSARREISHQIFEKHYGRGTLRFPRLHASAAQFPCLQDLGKAKTRLVARAQLARQMGRQDPVYL